MHKSRRQEILDRAAYLFRKQGYRGTSLKAIAQAVGMEAAPSLYNHISSKQAILDELLMGIALAFEKGMSDVQASSLTPRTKLEKIISLHVNLTFQYPDAIALIWHEWVNLEPQKREAFVKLRSEYEESFKTILSAGMEAKQFKQLDVELVLFTLISTLRALYAWHTRHKGYNPVELEEQLKQVLLTGIVNPEVPY